MVQKAKIKCVTKIQGKPEKNEEEEEGKAAPNGTANKALRPHFIGPRG